VKTRPQVSQEDPGCTDRAELEELSFTKIRTLATVEAWVFGHSQGVSGLILRHPQYWPTPDSVDNVLLRIDVL
jgi:hypothetical protein